MTTVSFEKKRCVTIAREIVDGLEDRFAKPGKSRLRSLSTVLEVLLNATWICLLRLAEEDDDQVEFLTKRCLKRLREAAFEE